MDQFSASDHPHNRYNPLNGTWVLVSPHRCKRPWQGQTEDVSNKSKIEANQSHENPLCPGATRPNGQINPDYNSTFVFDNDFPALIETVPAIPEHDSDPLFRVASASGRCRVICFHPMPSKTIATMTENEILNVVKAWIQETISLGAKYNWVQIFENKGAVMGCSNPHPHCQVWASNFLPSDIQVKDRFQKEYFTKYGRPLLIDYVEKEIQKKERIVLENSDWLVVVPWWATWPYETLVLPKRHIQRFNDLTVDEQHSIVKISKTLTTKYDNLFQTSFPYSMGWHGAPTGEYLNSDTTHWVFHGMYCPPLLRSATIKKFMVGYELLAQAQRDLTPEQAAATLRNQSTVHYTDIETQKI